MKPLLAIALVLGCASSQRHAVTLPTGIDEIGGFYQPWTPRHERETRDVLACVGRDTLGSRPTLWVAPRPLVMGGELAMAFYDPAARAVVFSPMAMDPRLYWSVFRHELLHHATRADNDAPVFALADSCDFWPAR